MTVAEYLLPAWLIALRAMDPGAAVALMAVNSADVAGAVLADAADVGFVEGPDLPDGLRAEPVGADVLTVIVAPAHPWALRARRGGRRGITARELAGTPLVAREAARARAATSRKRWPPRPAWTGCHRSRSCPPPPRSRPRSPPGPAPAVLSSLAVAADLAAGTLCAVPVSGLDLRRTLRAVWPAGCRLTGPARDLYAIAARSGTRPPARARP